MSVILACCMTFLVYRLLLNQTKFGRFMLVILALVVWYNVEQAWKRPTVSIDNLFDAIFVPGGTICAVFLVVVWILNGKSTQ